MISKELLSEVLGYEVKEVLGMLENSANKTILSYIFENTSLNEGKRTINIYELAHKGKEWACRQGYVILSGHSAYGIGAFFCSCKGWLSENYDKRIEINNNTEPEVIFKACQWILENKENK